MSQAWETLCKLEPATLAQYAGAVLAKLEDYSDWHIRRSALEALARLEPATLAEHANAVLARLQDTNYNVRRAAFLTLQKLEPATLAQHADAVVEQLEDSDQRVRAFALDTLAKLEPATLAQYSGAVVARLDDYITWPCIAAVKALGKLEPTTLAQLTSAVLKMVDVLEDGSLDVRTAVVATLRALPRCVIHDVDLESHDLDYLHGRLLGRLAWYRCRLRWRVRRFALYWYSLPYRPSGPGHARDVEAWDRMVGRRVAPRTG